MNSIEKVKMGKGKAKKVNRDLTSEQCDIVTSNPCFYANI